MKRIPVLAVLLLPVACAAAEPPARPVPTTITVNFRLLAGFTSFILNL